MVQEITCHYKVAFPVEKVYANMREFCPIPLLGGARASNSASHHRAMQQPPSAWLNAPSVILCSLTVRIRRYRSTPRCAAVPPCRPVSPPAAR